VLLCLDELAVDGAGENIPHDLPNRTRASHVCIPVYMHEESYRKKVTFLQTSPASLAGDDIMMSSCLCGN
jgi:hypothetical protein